MPTTTVRNPLSRYLNIALWAAQVLLAGAFLMAGTMKSLTPVGELQKSMPAAAVIPEWLLRFIGISEVAAGLGLVLPMLLRIRPMLTAYAAFGIVVVMILAAGFHLGRNEYTSIPSNVLFGVLALFVAWGRSEIRAGGISGIHAGGTSRH